ncbi:MAG: D-isomer specific 2-hydroxyacid dehydrogenase family protein [Eubacteriales bacterium]
MKLFFYALREFDELEYCEQYKEEFGIDFAHTAEYPTLENVSLARGCEAISMTPCEMSAQLLEAFAGIGVKYICCRSIGYDHVDLIKAKELGMKVSNVTYPPNGVANYAIMMMMMCTRNMQHILKRVELQDYSLKKKLGRDLTMCTVGIMGTGKIGATVIKHLSGFGCRILAYDPYENKEVKKFAEYVNLEYLFEQSDVISLHMNATEENHHIICKESIQKMKDGVVIVNTARGKLVDSEALIEGLENKKIGGAALDVLEKEDGLYYYNRMAEVIVNRKLAILRSFPNVIMSPHTAFYTRQDVSDMVKGCFESVEAFANHKETCHEIQL